MIPRSVFFFEGNANFIPKRFKGPKSLRLPFPAQQSNALIGCRKSTSTPTEQAIVNHRSLLHPRIHRQVAEKKNDSPGAVMHDPKRGLLTGVLNA
jgi:hypothetical protein